MRKEKNKIKYKIVYIQCGSKECKNGTNKKRFMFCEHCSVPSIFKEKKP